MATATSLGIAMLYERGNDGRSVRGWCWCRFKWARTASTCESGTTNKSRIHFAQAGGRATVGGTKASNGSLSDDAFLERIFLTLTARRSGAERERSREEGGAFQPLAPPHHHHRSHRLPPPASSLAAAASLASFMVGAPSLVAYERLERLSLLASLSITHPCFHHRLGSTEIPSSTTSSTSASSASSSSSSSSSGSSQWKPPPPPTLRLHSSVPQAVAQRVAPRRRRWLSCCRRLVVLLVQHSPTTKPTRRLQQRSPPTRRLLHHRRVAHLLLHPYPSGSGRRSDQQGGLHTHQCRGRSSSHREPAQHARRSPQGACLVAALRHQLGRQQ